MCTAHEEVCVPAVCAILFTDTDELIEHDSKIPSGPDVVGCDQHW